MKTKYGYIMISCGPCYGIQIDGEEPMLVGCILNEEEQARRLDAAHDPAKVGRKRWWALWQNHDKVIGNHFGWNEKRYELRRVERSKLPFVILDQLDSMAQDWMGDLAQITQFEDFCGKETIEDMKFSDVEKRYMKPELRSPIDPEHFHNTYPRYVKRTIANGKPPHREMEFFRQKKLWAEKQLAKSQKDISLRDRERCRRCEEPAYEDGLCESCIMDDIHDG